MAIAAPYRARRFLAFLDPWEDPLGSGFHIIQSLLALGSGGLFGVGLGRSRQKFLYLPMQHTDFIFAIIGEELGFVGAAFVLILYFLFAWRGLRIAIATEDPFGKLLAVGITTMTVSYTHLIGGVFVLEALSVIIQVTYFRLTRGKRVFKMSPIHHHFELSGWKEPKVVTRFWILGFVFSLLGFWVLFKYWAAK